MSFVFYLPSFGNKDCGYNKNLKKSNPLLFVFYIKDIKD